MKTIKIYPILGEDIGNREVLYIVCKANSEDIKKTYSKNNAKRRSIGEIPVVCYKPGSNVPFKMFKSISDASTQLKIEPSNISKATKGKIPTAGGFKWKLV